MKESKFTIDRTRIVSEDINEILLCKICLEVLDDPMECDVCNSEFCRQCIEDWYARNPACPNRCMDAKIQRPHKLVLEMLMNLKIKCSNTETGCNVVDTVEIIKSHEETCPFKIVQCPNFDLGCKEKIANKDMEIHLKDCEYNIEDCPEGCGKKLKKKDIKDHSCIQYLHKQIKDDEVKLELLKKKLNELKVNTAEICFIHKGIECDKCKEKDIIGQVYQCQICNNLNLCEFCCKIAKHKHDMILVPTQSFVTQLMNLDMNIINHPIKGPMKRYRASIFVKNNSNMGFTLRFISDMENKIEYINASYFQIGELKTISQCLMFEMPVILKLKEVTFNLHSLEYERIYGIPIIINLDQ